MPRGHGGKREGAGAKPKFATQLARAEKLATQLKRGVDSGLRRLAGKYDDLIKEALEIALAPHPHGPSREQISMIKTLLEMGIRVYKGDDDDTDAPFAKLAQKWVLEQLKGLPEDEAAIVEGEAREI